MHYTVQQLQGGPNYSHKTRIGNWNEDMELAAIKYVSSLLIDPCENSRTF